MYQLMGDRAVEALNLLPYLNKADLLHFIVGVLRRLNIRAPKACQVLDNT
jgi:hypothetical protein